MQYCTHQYYNAATLGSPHSIAISLLHRSLTLSTRAAPHSVSCCMLLTGKHRKDRKTLRGSCHTHGQFPEPPQAHAGTAAVSGYACCRVCHTCYVLQVLQAAASSLQSSLMPSGIVPTHLEVCCAVACSVTGVSPCQWFLMCSGMLFTIVALVRCKCQALPQSLGCFRVFRHIVPQATTTQWFLMLSTMASAR